MRKLVYLISSVVFAFFAWVYLVHGPTTPDMEWYHWILGIVCLFTSFADFVIMTHQPFKWKTWR